ncbi:MAG TPA: DUF1684 domain-containing protein [Actinomycetota bacterium]
MAPPHEREVLAWRARRIARLIGPEGWLAVVGLFWLEEGDNPVGSDPSCRVILPAGKAPSQVGTIGVGKAGVRFEAGPRSGVTHLGAEVATLDLRDDHEGEPTVLELGSLRFHLIRRFDRLAVRVRDTEGAGRQTFAGIASYPVDPSWRFEARYEPHQPIRASHVPTVLGMDEVYATPGALAFVVAGETRRLEAFLEPGETDLFIVFGDLTNGTETYGGGRYLSTAPPDDQGRVVLDFNKAYNPPCVFTSYATCALPLPANRLPLRVEAGEKLYDPAPFS